MTGGPTDCGRRAVNTLITVNPADWEVPFSKLSIRTKDRPGLLVEVVKVLKDINVNVISAEVGADVHACSIGRPEARSPSRGASRARRLCNQLRFLR